MENGELSEVAEPFSAVRSTYYSVRHKRGEKRQVDSRQAGSEGNAEERRRRRRNRKRAAWCIVARATRSDLHTHYTVE